MIYKEPTIYKSGGDNSYTLKEYNYTVLPKYSSYFSQQIKNLKSCSNGVVQLCGSIHITTSFTPTHDASDGAHSSNEWPLVCYFENVDFLENESNQSTLFYYLQSNIPNIISAVIEIVPSEKKVYVRLTHRNITPEYYHLMGTFLA